MASNKVLLDGRYARGFYTGRPRISYPFKSNGDYTTIQIDRDWCQSEAFYQVGKLGVDKDPKYNDAYLILETEPQPVGQGDAIKTARTFARVPADQVTYSSRVITKPAPASVAAVNYVLFEFPSTFLGYAQIYNGYFWGNGEVFGPEMVSTSADSGANTRVNKSGHGIAGTERIAFYQASALQVFFLSSGNYTVVDANNIDILGVNLGTAVTKLAEYRRDYTSGTDRVGLRRTQRFYLPGVTAGINGPTDIPLPTLLLNDAEFLSSVATNLTGYQTYDASELTRWMDSPIYTQTFDEIDMADV